MTANDEPADGYAPEIQAEPPNLRELKWGESPWDGLAREELLREVQRLHAATVAAHSVLKLAAMSDPHSPYWTDARGTGGRTLSKVEMALALSAAKGCDPSDVYRKFFRYAGDLLFTPALGFGWWICDHCGTMLGSDPDGVQRNRACLEPKCGKAPLRPITWGDLTPKE